MKFTYVPAPVSFHLEGEFGFGPNEGASLYHTRIKIIKSFLGNKDHILQVKCGYGEERNPDFIEAKLLKENPVGVKIIPSNIRLIDFYGESDVIIFERLSTGFYELVSSNIPLISYIPNPLIFSKTFLEMAEDRSIMCRGSREFEMKLKALAAKTNEEILKEFEGKEFSKRLKEIMINMTQQSSLERHCQVIGKLDY